MGDDNVAVMARSGVKDSFAVEPDLLDTLESCENQFLEIEKQASYIKVIFDREDDNYSTSKTKPIEGCSKLTKYLIDIDKIYWHTNGIFLYLSHQKGTSYQFLVFMPFYITHV